MSRWGLFCLHISHDSSWRTSACFYLALQECLFRNPAELSRGDIVYFTQITVALWTLQWSIWPPLTCLPGRWCCGVAWGVVSLNVATRMLSYFSAGTAVQPGRGRWCLPRYCSDIHLKYCQIVQWNLRSEKLCIFTGEAYTTERYK